MSRKQMSVEVHLFEARWSLLFPSPGTHRRVSLPRWAAAAPLFVAAAAGFCQAPAPLTLQQAIDLARMKNPSLLSADAHVTATKQSEITAGLRANPNLNLTGSDVSLPADSNNPYFYSAQVSRLFERGEKR